MASTNRILFLDPFSGISGDMFVGALLDLGVDLAQLAHEISKLGLAGYHLSARRVARGAMTATKFDVEIRGTMQREFDAEISGQIHEEHSHGHDGHGGHDHSASAHDYGHSHASTSDAANASTDKRRNFREIKTLIQQSRLSDRVKKSSIAAFQKLADAEGRIHGVPPDDVAFHEVGALDSIIDFVAVCAGLELLNIDEVWCGPLALGRGGWVKCDHGLMPVPAPATMEIVKGMPLRDAPVEKELTTPTGAALLAALVTQFCAVPAMVTTTIGYGAGSREQQTVPNVLRALLGSTQNVELSPNPQEPDSDEIIEMRANIDDATPEVLSYLMEALFQGGAWDVFFTAIQMKKNRPGMLVTVLAEPKILNDLIDILFRESPTFGVRYETLKRKILARETVLIATQGRDVRVKLGRWRGTLCSIHPEYEDCRALARELNIPLRQVIATALSDARKAEGEKKP